MSSPWWSAARRGRPSPAEAVELRVRVGSHYAAVRGVCEQIGRRKPSADRRKFTRQDGFTQCRGFWCNESGGGARSRQWSALSEELNMTQVCRSAICPPGRHQRRMWAMNQSSACCTANCRRRRCRTARSVSAVIWRSADERSRSAAQCLPRRGGAHEGSAAGSQPTGPVTDARCPAVGGFVVGTSAVSSLMGVRVTAKPEWRRRLWCSMTDKQETIAESPTGAQLGEQAEAGGRRAKVKVP